MSVLQYVGARYVPKLFKAPDGTMEWQADSFYEPLTVVTYNNASYISRIPVSATIGNPAQNPEYWAFSGSYNGFIGELQRQIDELAERERELKQTVYNYHLRNYQNEIVLMGDSWADVRNVTEVRIPNVIAGCFNANVHNYAWAGTGFDVPNGYDEQIEKMSADETLDISKVSMVILICGLNEFTAGNSSSDFTEKLRDWYTKVREKTSAPIYWFFNYGINGSVNGNNRMDFYTQFNYFFDVKSNMRIPINAISMMGWITFNELANNWKTDYYHPNLSGSEEVGLKICDAIKGNPVSSSDYMYCTGTWKVGETVHSIGGQCIQHDNVIYIALRGGISVLHDLKTPTLIEWSLPLPGKWNSNTALGLYGYINTQGAVVPYEMAEKPARIGNLTQGLNILYRY